MYVVEAAEDMLVPQLSGRAISCLFAAQFRAFLPRNITGEYEDDLLKLFLVFGFPQLVFTYL